MILTFKSKAGLTKSFTSGKLNGYLPSKGFDANKVVYPVEIEVCEETKTFKLKTEAKTVDKRTKLAKYKWWIVGVSLSVLALIITILVVVL